MIDIDFSLNEKKFNSNLKSINTKEINGRLECLDLDSYISFLRDISFKISKDLEMG